jgi:hypothetical protein
MPAEGMVHALELVHGLLTPKGFLVDIHPMDEPPPIEITLARKTCSVGNIQEKDDFIEYRQADAALAYAIQNNLFTLERYSNFTFLNHADSLAELHLYLEENWSDCIWTDEITQHAALLYAQEAYKENRATLRENVHITRLHRLSPNLDESPSR